MDQSTHSTGLTIEKIVDAALDIIVAQGLAALTLRPLATGINVSVPAISARMGTKDQLVSRVIEEASSRDREFGERWTAIADSVGPIDSMARATLTDLAFRDWLSSGRQQLFCLIESVHDRALQKAPWPVLDDWLDRAGAFWSTLIFGHADFSDLAMGYILDEAAFALGAGDNQTYTLLRVLCLQRLSSGVFPPSEAVKDRVAAIPQLIALLEPATLPVTDSDDPKRRRIADCAAQIIVSQGIESVTHRSVALAANVPASTVVYHFGARNALVVAGLYAVTKQFGAMRNGAIEDKVMPPIAEASGRDLVKATSMIALASAREPNLVPHAIDMRRRRGENIRATDLVWLGLRTDAGFDRATAQVVSIALFGMHMIAMARNVPEHPYYTRAFAALGDSGDTAGS